LETDRPDFTESDVVIGKGVIQFETGITVERERGGNSLTLPEVLLRIGIGKRLELRFGGDGFLVDHGSGAGSTRGHSDTEVAAKIGILKQGPHTPAISLIPILSVPSGSKDFSSGGYDPTLKLALGKDLRKGFYVGGNVNFSSRSGPGGRFFQNAMSLSLDHELGHHFGAFWEVFGFQALEKGGPAAFIADTGVTRDINKNTQIDLRVGRRLSAAGPGLYWGMGIVVRQTPNWFVH
jgi:hypothetical protein